jgi:hypothetical protein
MSIQTWDPEKRDAVLERAKKIGLEHKGEKVLGSWVDISGLRSYQLIDVPSDIDPMQHLKNYFAWNDIMRIETIPVIEAGEMIKALSSMK